MDATREKVIRVAIVNRFCPPDPAITGQSAYGLAEHIAGTIPNAEVSIYATKARYAGGRVETSGDCLRVHRIRSFYYGSSKMLRLGSSLFDGIRLARDATRYADFVISLTDPPLLGLWVGLAQNLRSFRWAEWTMDLYPEAFVAAKFISAQNPLYKKLHRAVQARLPERYIALGPMQRAYLRSVRGPSQAFELPCGITTPEFGPVPDWRRKHSERIVCAYAGNLGEAHSEQGLIDLVTRADPKKFHFLLSLYGAKAAQTKKRLDGLPHILWKDFLPHAELAYADAHIVSLTRPWTHICVPSKAVSSICLGRPIIFLGDESGDNWALLNRAAWLIPEWSDGTYHIDDIHRVLAALVDPLQRERKRLEAVALRAELIRKRDATLAAICEWISGHEGLDGESVNCASSHAREMRRG